MEKRASDPMLKGKTIEQMVAICSEEWNSMDAERKRPYKDTAEELSRGQTEPSNHNEENMMEGKFDSMGNSMKAKRIKEMQKDGLLQLMQEDIIRTVKSDDATDFRFHIMAAHSWCKLDSEEYDLIPVEICMIEMSLKKGVIRKWLQKIDPGDLPTGYKAEMRLESDKNHKLWTDNVELTDSYGDIVNKLIEILSAKDHERYVGKDIDFTSEVEPPLNVKTAFQRRLLPIFCLEADIGDNQKMLRWLIKNSKPKIEVDFVFYHLEFLFQQLILLCPNNTSKLTIGAAEAYITRDVFLYLPAMSCGEHQELESCNCAGSRASRYAYVITDFCCQMYGIMPKEGAHLPHGVALGQIVVGDPHPSFMDETGNADCKSLMDANISFLADQQMAEAKRMDNIPEACRLNVEFPGGTNVHMMTPMWTKIPKDLQTDSNAKFEYLSVDEFFEKHGVQNFNFDMPGLSGVDTSIFTEPLYGSTTKNESGANESFSFLEKFFEDPTLKPILKTSIVREN